MTMKIGELAKQTGLTVRTLHHYHDIGLLTPSIRSGAGYRLYTKDDIRRLTRIQALKQLGFSLADIGNLLTGDGTSLPDILTQQLAALEQQMTKAARLREQLLRLQQQLRQGEEPALGDWLTTLELMSMYDKYFTPAQLQDLNHYRQQAKDDLESDWPVLIRKVQQAMQNRLDPATPAVQALAQQWTELLQKLVGEDPGLLIRLDAMTRQETAVQEQTGINAELLAYISAARAAMQATVLGSYLNAEELAQVQANQRQHAAEWPPLIMAVRMAMEQGAATDSAEVQQLAMRWQNLFEKSMSGGNTQIQTKLRQAFSKEPGLLRGSSIDPAMLEYMRNAISGLPAPEPVAVK